LLGAFKVIFYDGNGREQQSFDYSNDDGTRAFTCCCFNPSGDAAVAGAFSRFYVYTLNTAKGTWEQVYMQQVTLNAPVLIAKASTSASFAVLKSKKPNGKGFFSSKQRTLVLSTMSSCKESNWK
jgi:hypothetical protein